MLPTSLKHYWLAVTAIALGSLLSTSSVDANPITFNLQASLGGMDTPLSEMFAKGQTISGPYTLQSPDALPLDTTDGAYSGTLSVLSLGTTRRASAEADFNSFLEGLRLSPSDGYAVNAFLQVNTAAVLKTDAAPTPPDPSKLTSTGISLLFQKFFVGLTLLRATVTSLSKAVPQPAALILLGSGLLGLAFGIRRITTKKDSDNKSDSEERGFSLNTEPEANYPEAELADPAAPLFHQNASGRTDSISLSQPS